MMADDATLKGLLGQAFEIARQRSEDQSFEDHKFDFVFHMTDWRKDLETLHQMFSFPERWDADAACVFLIGFLSHVIPHLNAAGKLLVDNVGDPFCRGD